MTTWGPDCDVLGQVLKSADEVDAVRAEVSELVRRFLVYPGCG